MVFTDILPIQAHALGHLLNDPQICFGLARRLHSLTSHLHHPVGVGHSAGFFRPCASRQNNIRQPRCLGHENILNHQML